MPLYFSKKRHFPGLGADKSPDERPSKPGTPRSQSDNSDSSIPPTSKIQGCFHFSILSEFHSQSCEFCRQIEPVCYRPELALPYREVSWWNAPLKNCKIWVWWPLQALATILLVEIDVCWEPMARSLEPAAKYCECGRLIRQLRQFSNAPRVVSKASETVRVANNLEWEFSNRNSAMSEILKEMRQCEHPIHWLERRRIVDPGQFGSRPPSAAGTSHS